MNNISHSYVDGRYPKTDINGQKIFWTPKRAKMVTDIINLTHGGKSERWINTLRLTQNGRYFPNNIFKCILLNENVWILLIISLKFVPQVRINNIPISVQIMAWRQPGDKPLSEPILVNLLTHLCLNDLTGQSWLRLSVNSNFHWNQIPCIWYFSPWIPAKFCTCHDSNVVVTCACCDLVAYVWAINTQGPVSI